MNHVTRAKLRALKLFGFARALAEQSEPHDFTRDLSTFVHTRVMRQLSPTAGP